jgi:hypothetical protein
MRRYPGAGGGGPAEDDSGRKPFFNMALGEAERTLLVVPPFSFPGVTARVFPLRASMDILASFCRRYLNVAPPEVCVLQPSLPYVFLVILDYGQMAIETANLGWVSQHEVFFAIPLQKWYRRKGRMVFDGWVLNTPFIFVDNASSLTTGREVYGWPKVLARFRPGLDEWLADPRNPNQLLSLSVRGFGGRDAEKLPLLEIDQRLGQSPSLAPGDLAAAVDPFGRLSRLTRGAWLAGVELTELLLRSPLSGFGPQMGGMEGGFQVFSASLRQLLGLTREPGVEVVTLKQFRDTADPGNICYQALVQSRLKVDRVDHGGPLGLYNLLQGDPTGGFRIRLYDHPAFQIVASLGLKTYRQRTFRGHEVSILEPVFPSWMSVDLTYGRGENLGWRMLDSPWYGKESETVRSTRRSSGYSFNTVAGAGEQEWAGPYTIPKAACDIFPLKVVDLEQLDRFISGYLGSAEPHSFKRWGDYIYLVASRSRIFSQARSSVYSQVAIFLPLLWYQNGELKAFAMTKPYAFIDDPTTAMSMREVAGIPAMDATIETPRRSWLKQGPVLQVKTDVFTVLDAGLESRRRTLIEVVSPVGLPSPPPPPEAPADPVEQALLEKAGDAFFPAPMPLLALKQFRDARDPDLACYQALILEPWTFFGGDPHLLGDGMKIRIYQYPSLPLATTLGLVDLNQPPIQLRGKKKKRIMVDELTPDVPFRIELNVRIGLSQVLSRTAGNLPWMPQEGEDKWTPRQKEGNEALGVLYKDLVEAGPQPLIRKLIKLP